MDRGNRTRVEDVMSSPVRTIRSDATVREAATRMRDEEISSLLVPTDPPGIVTSTDVLDVVAGGGEPGELAVADVMTSPVETIPPDLLIEEVAAMMTSFGIKHLPVVEDDYVGMISSTDVTAHLS
jgi:CBS domain-containing protein